jgi:hypothetical protein
MTVTGRKPRRLSIAQARACELGHAIKPGARYKSRCRCGGRFYGACRVPAKATRWDFAVLPEDDPHYIPRPRRRISNRTAATLLSRARAEHVRTHAAQQVLREAANATAVEVAKERVHSEVRTRRSRILAGYFYPWRRRNRGDFHLKSWRGEYHPADPLGWALRFLQSCVKHLRAWRDRRTLGPPGQRAGPPVDPRTMPAVELLFLQAQMELA